jgi:ferric-dicitrate binding protein FerR (iron transport regulator)/tetratricopeptide (TPR) repeat protein
MNSQNRPGDVREPHDVAEQNLRRLLGQAYRPEAPDAAFARQLTARLWDVARDTAATRRPPAAPDALRASRRQRFWALAAAASLAGVAFGLHTLTEPPAPAPRPAGPQVTRRLAGARQHPPAVAPQAEGKEQEKLLLGAVLPRTQPEGRDARALAQQLTPRPRPPAPAPETVAPGATVRTGAGERRRVTLPDDSVLYLNENTTARVLADRHVALARGEVFVEVAPRAPDSAGATFVVQTDRREVSALGTKFAVRAADAGTGVVVTQGKVRVTGLDRPLFSGQELAPGSAEPEPAPRASYVLDWARDLIIAAESPLVPQSKYAGGALVALDPGGQEAQLSLRKYRVDVHVEDGFARTTIDQTYFNHQTVRLEGTFHFPLLADASLSRLAMYVDGNLMEGGMAERQYAQQVFENIVRRQKDPALLEWVDGTTFKMRVFPLEPRQEKRIILSYTQKVPSLYGRSQYRFPAGHSLGQARDWSFHALVKNGAGLDWHSPTHELKATTKGKDLLLDAEAKQVKVDQDVVVDLTDKGVKAGEDTARFSSAASQGSRYLMLRYRPALAVEAERQRRDWVFLFESSGDRDPLLARVQVDVVRTLLANAEHDDTFAVLTAGASVRAFAAEPVPATPENVKAAVDFLEHTHLVGGLDLGGALAAAGPFVRAGKNPYLVHLGSGIASLGEGREDALAGRVPEGARYVGVAVGKRWARGFMKAAAERSDGYFTQINPDEPVGWRAFELFSTLNTPRLLNVQVVDNAEKVRFLTQSGSLAQGEELCAMGCAGTEKDPLPESLTLSGTLDGKPFRRVVKVKDVAEGADYLPRSWARLEIDRLLAEDATKNKDRIVALSKSMYVMTPFTSLLVLENEAMYDQFKVDRGRTDHWALYDCPKKIPIITEPLPNQPAVAAAPAARPADDQLLDTILVRTPPRVVLWPGQANQARGQPTVTATALSRDGYVVQWGELTEGELGLDPKAALERLEDVGAEWQYRQSVSGAAGPLSAGGVPGMPADAPGPNVPAAPDFDKRTLRDREESAAKLRSWNLSAPGKPTPNADKSMATGAAPAPSSVPMGDGSLRAPTGMPGPGGAGGPGPVPGGMAPPVGAGGRVSSAPLFHDGTTNGVQFGGQAGQGRGGLMPQGGYAGTGGLGGLYSGFGIMGGGFGSSPAGGGAFGGYGYQAGGMGYGGMQGGGMQGGFAGVPGGNPFYYPYSVPYYSYVDPYGGGLRGAADAIRAQGQFEQDFQRARLLNQEVERSKLDTRRKIYDEWLYERANRPTIVDDQERLQKLEQRRALVGMPLSEVLSGYALNTLLDDLEKNPNRNLKDGFGPIDPEVLRQINVTSGKGGGNVGVLKPVKEGSSLTWPLPLQGAAYQDEVRRLNQRAAEAVKRVQDTGQVDPGTLNEMREDVGRLRRKVGDHINEMTPAQSIEANRYLNQMSDATTALARPDVASYFTDKFAAKGKTVPELVQFMATKGLKFAPATAGDEAAYSALYNYLAGHALQVQPNQAEKKRSAGSDRPPAPPADTEPILRDGWTDATRLWATLPPGGPQDLVDVRVARLLAGVGATSPLYERPTYNPDDRLFTDLLAYAPGMNTSRADVLAVLDAEGAPDPQAAPGRIDPDARRLIDRARAAGWQKVTFPARDGKAALTLVCDGGGRYAYEHTLPAGLAERVVCDGKVLLHLYPELGVGARRTLSRFHRAEFATLVPWVLPPAEDLAAGAEVTAAGERTVAVVLRLPAGGDGAGPRVGLHLVFAADGRLAERRRVELPSGKVLGREVYDAGGTVRLVDADGKEVAVRTLAVAPAAAPDPAPDTQQLVVLSLPLRTREQVINANTPQWTGRYDTLGPGFGLALIAADRGDGKAEAQQIVQQRFVQQGDRRPGFCTLWAATGQALDQLPLPDPQAAPALTRYLRWLKQRSTGGAAAETGGLGDGLFGRLVTFAGLAQPWRQNDGSVLQGDEYTRLLEFLGAGKPPALTWALTSLVLEDRTRHTVLPGGMAAVKRRVLEEAGRSLAGVPGLGYVARYEQARLCWEAGDRDRARELFRGAYRDCLKDGILPPVDGTFREALGGNDWTALVRETAGRLLAEHQPLAVLTLARQAGLLDDQPLAGDLTDDVLAKAAAGPQRLPVSLTALEDLWETHQYERADRLLRELLADDAFSGRASLWRLGARFAAERHQPERQYECLGRALELEYRHLPEEIDVAAVRRDYGELLGYYERLAGALATLHQPPPRDFLVRVVSAADRWRALDMESGAPAEAAARILKALGADDLAWDYITTPLGGRPSDPQAAVGLARTLAGEGKRELAERAYRLAGEADPNNGEVVWERAENLQEAGRPAEARQVLRPLADGTWAPQFQELQRQARSRLGERLIQTK